MWFTVEQKCPKGIADLKYKKLCKAVPLNAMVALGGEEV
jgi:hypothetical protein